MDELKTLLIKWDQCNKKIEKIQNDPDYIREETEKIFKNREKRDYSKDIANIMASL